MYERTGIAKLIFRPGAQDHSSCMRHTNHARAHTHKHLVPTQILYAGINTNLSQLSLQSYEVRIRLSI